MNRLTETAWRNLDPWECCGQDHFCTRGCHDDGGCIKGCIVPKLYARLAAYEDTGLTPGDVKDLQALCKENGLAKYVDLIVEAKRQMSISNDRDIEQDERIEALTAENARLRADLEGLMGDTAGGAACSLCTRANCEISRIPPRCNPQWRGMEGKA